MFVEVEDGDMATIKVNRLFELTEAERLLEALLAAGVDNWEGYSGAIDMLHEGDE